MHSDQMRTYGISESIIQALTFCQLCRDIGHVSRIRDAILSFVVAEETRSQAPPPARNNSRVAFIVRVKGDKLK